MMLVAEMFGRPVVSLQYLPATTAVADRVAHIHGVMTLDLIDDENLALSSFSGSTDDLGSTKA